MPSGGDEGPSDEVTVYHDETDPTEKHISEENLNDDKEDIVGVADEEAEASTSSAGAQVTGGQHGRKNSSSGVEGRRISHGGTIGGAKGCGDPGAFLTPNKMPTEFFNPHAMTGQYGSPYFLYPYPTTGFNFFGVGGNRLPVPFPHAAAPFPFLYGSPSAPDSLGGPPPAHMGIPVFGEKTGVRSPFYPFGGGAQFTPQQHLYAEYLAASMANLQSGGLGSNFLPGFPTNGYQRMGMSPGMGFMPHSPAALSPLQSPAGTEIKTAQLMPPPRNTPDTPGGLHRPTSSSSASSTPLPPSMGCNFSSAGSRSFLQNPLGFLAQIKPPSATASVTSVAASAATMNTLMSGAKLSLNGNGHHRNSLHSTGSSELNGLSGGHSQGNHNTGGATTNGHGQTQTAFNKAAKAEKERTHIKKPLNAFMLYMKENRPRVMAQVGLQERQSAEINRILGREWHQLDKAKQQKYYDMAREERQSHMQKYPGWSARDNYAIHKKRKRKRDKAQDNMELKKCRARFGLSQQDRWCKHCRRKKKCLRFKEGDGDDDSTNSPPAQVSSTTHFLGGGPPSVEPPGGPLSNGSLELGGHPVKNGLSGGPSVKRSKLNSVDSVGEAASPYSHVTSTTHHLGLGPAGNPLSVGSSAASASTDGMPNGAESDDSDDDMSDDGRPISYGSDDSNVLSMSDFDPEEHINSSVGLTTPTVVETPGKLDTGATILTIQLEAQNLLADESVGKTKLKWDPTGYLAQTATSTTLKTVAAADVITTTPQGLKVGVSL